MKTNGEPERQGYHHGDLRRALLEAAEVELAEKGPEGFTLRGCAKRAGVSHAAPAHHFGDVAGLLSALAAEGFERFLKTTSARMNAADPGDARARLVAMGLGYIEFARANPALFSLMFSSRKADFQEDRLQRAATASFEQLVAGVGAVAGVAPLTTREGRRQLAATWAIVHGLAHLLLSQRMKFLQDQSSEELEEDLAAIVSRVLG
ncbi:TetR/AcrR family transcriptional regulator [Neoaquamicrobium sediminum]|uniref:TetR/AcrR family transcriptional regulator n=1 Tax=Neoaquamicrobium sediminum TaxID=1849104 RepID=A0ABV3WZP0_9HYPH